MSPPSLAKPILALTLSVAGKRHVAPQARAGVATKLRKL